MNQAASQTETLQIIIQPQIRNYMPYMNKAAVTYCRHGMCLYIDQQIYSGIAMRTFFIAALILAAFYWGYSDMVGDPFVGKLELGEFVGRTTDLMGDTSDIPIPKIFLVIIAFALPRLIKLMFSDSSDKRSHPDEKSAKQQ